MKKILLAIVGLFSIMIFSQNQERRFSNEKETYPAILVGYQFLGEAKDKTETWKGAKMHAVEIAYGKVTDFNSRHGEGRMYYVGTDLIFGFKDLILTPKVGFCGGGALMLGGEFQVQTDFNAVIPRVMPYIGIGGRGFRLFVGYNFRLMKSENLPINTGHIGLTLPIVKFKKKNA